MDMRRGFNLLVYSIIAVLIGIRLYNTFLFQILIESIVLFASILIVILVWVYKKYIDQSYIILIGIGYSHVIVFTFFHLLLVSDSAIMRNLNIAVYLWMANTTLQSITFLIACFIYKTKIKVNPYLIQLIYLLLIPGISTVIMAFDFLHEAYSIVRGLSPLIISIQLVNSLIMLISVYLYMYKSQFQFEHFYNKHLTDSSIYTVISIMALLLAQQHNDLFHTIGHIFRLFAVIYILRAICSIGIQMKHRVKRTIC